MFDRQRDSREGDVALFELQIAPPQAEHTHHEATEKGATSIH
jgi:hypothetical protein